MKILQVITSLRTGGAEKLMIDLIPKLKEFGIEVDLLVFDGSDTPFKKEALTRGVNVISLGVGNSAYNIKNLFKLLPYISKYDIIHSHNTSAQLFVFLGSLWKNNIIITTEHNTTNRRRKFKVFKLVDKLMYGRYNKIICISDKTYESLVKYLPQLSTKSVTINNGIDISKFITAQTSDELEIIAPHSKKLLMVAAFRNQKNQDTVIRALKLLDSNFHLFLVGDGDRKHICQNLVSRLGLQKRVHFLGLKENIPQLMKAADYIVLSSHWEGFGLSIIEGMAANKPVLASNVDGMREVVGDAAILFEPGNESELSQKILMLDNDVKLKKEMQDKGLIRVKNFDITRMTYEYISVYKSFNTGKRI